MGGRSHKTAKSLWTKSSTSVNELLKQCHECTPKEPKKVDDLINVREKDPPNLLLLGL